jgi:hypothetical protein
MCNRVTIIKLPGQAIVRNGFKFIYPSPSLSSSNCHCHLHHHYKILQELFNKEEILNRISLDERNGNMANVMCC